MKNTRGKLLVVAGGALALVAFLAWMIRPQTRYAGDFSESSFTAIKPGDSEGEVIRSVGRPLSSFEEETLEEWCFSQPETWQRRLSPSTSCQLVATDDQVIQFHRDHRDPEIHSVLRRRFFARTDGAEFAQGQCARG